MGVDPDVCVYISLPEKTTVTNEKGRWSHRGHTCEFDVLTKRDAHTAVVVALATATVVVAVVMAAATVVEAVAMKETVAMMKAVAMMEAMAMMEATGVDKQDKYFTFLSIFKVVITVLKFFLFLLIESSTCTLA